MKALSVRQPYAFAIVMGFKPVENREFTRKHRGPTLIHASRTEEHGHVLGTLMHISDQARMPLTEISSHDARGMVHRRLYRDVVLRRRRHPSRGGAAMTAPVRIQRKRAKGWRMPENTVSVARPGKGNYIL